MGNCKSITQAEIGITHTSSRPSRQSSDINKDTMYDRSTKRARIMFYGRADSGTADTDLGIESSRSEDAADIEQVANGNYDGTSFTTDNSGLVGINLLAADGSSFTTDTSHSGLAGSSLLADGASFTTDNSGLIGVSLLGDSAASASFTENQSQELDKSMIFGQSSRTNRNSPYMKNRIKDNGPGGTNDLNGIIHQTLFEEVEVQYFDEDEMDVEQSLNLVIKSPSDSRKLDDYYAKANRNRNRDNGKNAYSDQYMQNNGKLGIGTPTQYDRMIDDNLDCDVNDYYAMELMSLDDSLDDIKASLEHIQVQKSTTSSGSGAGSGTIRRNGNARRRRDHISNASGSGDYIRRTRPKSRNREAYRGLQRSLQLQDDGDFR